MGVNFKGRLKRLLATLVAGTLALSTTTSSAQIPNIGGGPVAQQVTNAANTAIGIAQGKSPVCLYNFMGNFLNGLLPGNLEQIMSNLLGKVDDIMKLQNSLMSVMNGIQQIQNLAGTLDSLQQNLQMLQNIQNSIAQLNQLTNAVNGLQGLIDSTGQIPANLMGQAQGYIDTINSLKPQIPNMQLGISQIQNMGAIVGNVRGGISNVQNFNLDIGQFTRDIGALQDAGAVLGSVGGGLNALNGIQAGLPGVDQAMNAVNMLQSPDIMNGINQLSNLPLDQIQGAMGALDAIPFDQLQGTLDSLGTLDLGNLPGVTQALGTFNNLAIPNLNNIPGLSQLSAQLSNLKLPNLNNIPGLQQLNAQIGQIQGMLNMPFEQLNAMMNQFTQLLAPLTGMLDQITGFLGSLTDMLSLSNLLSKIPGLQNLLNIFNMLNGMVPVGGILGNMLNQDNCFLTMKLNGKNIRGVQMAGQKPIYAKTTAVVSALSSMSPWLYISSKTDFKNSKTSVSRHRNNEYMDMNKMVGGVNACEDMIAPAAGDLSNDPAWQRLKMSNCADQYILERSLKPRVLFDKKGALSGLNEDFCQPLRLIPDDKPEYTLSEYIDKSWKKLLVNPTHSGIRVVKPKEKQKINKMKLNEVTQHQYERIYDPSHPFSPRWDYIDTERKLFSPGAALYDPVGAAMAFSPVDPSTIAAPIMGEVMGTAAGMLGGVANVSGVMRMASGVANAAGAGQALAALNNMPNAANIISMIPGITSALDWSLPSVACAIVPTDVMRFRMAKFSACMGQRLAYNNWCWTTNPETGCWIRHLATPKHPPCTTKFYGFDKASPLKCGRSISSCCEIITRPVTPLNTLKIRAEQQAFKDEKVPEGYKFRDYFEYRKPYMRWWDLGTESGGTGNTAKNGNAWNMLGAYDVIVGVGREGESCKIGGGGGKSPKGISIPKVDPITSWAELKLYQARSSRDAHLYCLGRFEMVYKNGGSEEMILSKMGASYTEWIKNTDGKQMSPEERSWIAGWRGYISDPDPKRRFPNLGGSGLGMVTPGGLQNAQTGDIAIWDEEIMGKNATRMPYIAFVDIPYNETTKVAGKTPEKMNVRVLPFNHGKYPDACGVTDSWGLGPGQTVYPPGGMPEDEKEAVKRAGGTISCDDPENEKCEDQYWGQVKLYRPSKDVR